MKKRKIIIISIIILIVISLGLNLYWVVWKQVEQKIFMNGANAAINSVLQSIQNTGEVRINTEKGQVILTPKTNQPMIQQPIIEEEE